jgi:hypothetical protein
LSRKPTCPRTLLCGHEESFAPRYLHVYLHVYLQSHVHPASRSLSLQGFSVSPLMEHANVEARSRCVVHSDGLQNLLPAFKFSFYKDMGDLLELYVEVRVIGVEAGLPVASRYVLHSHAEIKAGHLQSSLTPTPAYRPRLVTGRCIIKFRYWSQIYLLPSMFVLNRRETLCDWYKGRFMFPF